MLTFLLDVCAGFHSTRRVSWPSGEREGELPSGAAGAVITAMSLLRTTFWLVFGRALAEHRRGSGGGGVRGGRGGGRGNFVVGSGGIVR